MIAGRVQVPAEQLELGGVLGSRIDRLFAAHREAFPAVYRDLLAQAREARSRGWRRIGIALLWERLRWEHGPHKADVYGYGCNNDLKSRYARALAAENPELEGLFEFRALRGRS